MWRMHGERALGGLRSGEGEWSTDVRLPALLVAVVLLVVNDRVLKTAYGTWWTGKLSDFAGLFAFALFWGMLLPRARRLVAGLTAAGFVFWKSPLAGPLIDALNDWLPVTIARVVDWTDCAALIVVPFAARVAGRGPRWSPRHARDLALAGLSVFAFTGTSMHWEVIGYDEPYAMPASQEAVIEAIPAVGGEVVEGEERMEGFFPLDWEGPDCIPIIMEAVAEVRAGDSVSSTLRLREIAHQCGDSADSLDLKTVFEDQVVMPLRDTLNARGS